MNKLATQIFATTLMVATVASMAGCARTEERVTERIMPPMEREVGVQERTVAVEKTTDITQVQPGQARSYYTRQFEEMGYQIMDIERQNDRVIYDLGRGNEMRRVTLFEEPGTDKVSRLEIQKYTNVATNTQDKAMMNITQQVEKMPTGKMPLDYLPSLSKLGTVNEYHLHRDYATVELESGKKHYKVRMDVNPDTKKVTDVTLDRNIWEMPG